MRRRTVAGLDRAINFHYCKASSAEGSLQKPKMNVLRYSEQLSAPIA
jgi:hypothetical protein